MKVKIDSKKELFKWGPIDIKMLYVSVFIDTILVGLKKHNVLPWPPAVAVFKGGKMTWVLEETALQKTGRNYFKKYFLNLQNYKTLWRKWERWVLRHNLESKRLERLDLKKLPLKELVSELLSFVRLNRDFWLIVHIPEIANWGGEYLLKQRLKKQFNKEAEHYLEILAAPVKFSFFQKEELDLLKLASIRNRDELKKAVKNHAKNYHWILNSYSGNRVLTLAYFEGKLKKLMKIKSAKDHIREIEATIQSNEKRKIRLIKDLNLCKEVILMAEQLSESIWWQDLRKGYIWRMHYFWDKFAKEIARRTDWKFEEIQYCYIEELQTILEGKKISKKKVLARKNHYAFYTESGKCEEYADKKQVQKLFDVYLKVNVKNVKEIKELPVSKGENARVAGRVRIIENPFKDGREMKKGDILVAGMTSPEYIVLMRKAKAIITDQGGMTSHAAIVSRELKIPCIVGTKVATHVLKNGDLVEMDAERGIVKIIKRAEK